MRTTLLITSFTFALGLAAVAAPGSGVTYFSHDKVAKGGTLMTAADLSVHVMHRSAAGEVEVHAKETDTFYVLDGEATFVTGGKMVGGRVTAPNQERGKDITGGDTRHLAKGDVLVIPAGVPHWFKEVPRSIDYYVVKVIKP